MTNTLATIATRTAFGKALADLASKNENIVALDADLSGSTKSADLKKVDPTRHFNIGIAECNMMGVAAGLAIAGKTVFACTFAMFAAGRAWEQVRNTIAYSHIPVKVVGTHAGMLVGEDGASHQALEDIALMRSIPGLRVFSPADGVETEKLIAAVINDPHPAYIRLCRADTAVIYEDSYNFQIGKGSVLVDGTDAVIFATGPMVASALHAALKLKEEKISIAVVNISTISPIDGDIIEKYAKKTGFVFTAEDHSVHGGLGGAVAEVLCDRCPTQMMRIGMHDFGESGTGEDLYEKYGLDGNGVLETVRETLKTKKAWNS